MNRRDFLKTSLLSAAVLPMAGIPSFSAELNELERLYVYIEKHGKIKLYPFQKEILKQIHYNTNIVIVKARQIGMTTLLAGYISWLSSEKKTNTFYAGPTKNYFEELSRKFKLNNINDFFDQTIERVVDIYDEENFESDKLDLTIADMVEYSVKETITKNDGNFKRIVCGTLDSKDNLLAFIKKQTSLSSFRRWSFHKVSAKDAFPLWNENKIEFFRKICSSTDFYRETLLFS